MKHADIVALVEKAFNDPVESWPTGWRESYPALSAPGAATAKQRILQALAEAAEARLAPEGAAVKPFMYGVMDRHGKAVFDEDCVGPEPDDLKERWEVGDGDRVVPLFLAHPASDTALREALEAVVTAAKEMPRATPAPGGSATVHQFSIEAAVVWQLDAALKRLAALNPSEKNDGPA